jgi:hypothetical protein
MEEVRGLYDKVFIVDDVYRILQKAYATVEGGLNFKSKDDLISSTGLWRVVYCKSEIIGVIIYKAKRGSKMVALAMHEQFKKSAKEVFSYIFRKTFSKSWMEVSGAAEKYLMKLGAAQYRIANIHATEILGKEIIELCDDGYHYKRVINGIVKKKVMVGIPREW